MSVYIHETTRERSAQEWLDLGHDDVFRQSLAKQMCDVKPGLPTLHVLPHVYIYSLFRGGLVMLRSGWSELYRESDKFFGHFSNITDRIMPGLSAVSLYLSNNIL